MGVYIPNMEKPKNCFQCSFNDGIYCALIDNDTDAFISEDPTKVSTKRLDNCPLIEIVRCGECKHKPIKHDPEGDDFGFNLVSPNGYDNLCPCLNTDDGFYSYMPDDNFFCAYGERRNDENSDMDNSNNRTD